MALITKGIQLFWKSGPLPALDFDNAPTAVENGTLIPGVQEIGELAVAGGASAGYDKIEVTTLSDSKHQYVNGLQADEGDAASISFTLLYEPSLFSGLKEMFGNETDVAIGDYKGNGSTWNIVIPQGGKFTITGFGSIKLNSASVNSALTMTMTLTPALPISFSYEA